MNFDVNLWRDIFDSAVDVGCRRRATQKIANELVNDAETLPDAIPIHKISQWSAREFCSQALSVGLARPG